MKLHPVIRMALVMALLSGLSLAALLFYKPAPPPPPVLGTAPSFDLVNEAGQSFSSNSLKGKVWVADFFFSTCPGPCPKMSAHLGMLNRQFEGNLQVEMVSISVDPERDTPDILSRYEKKVDAVPETWHFLTGNPEDIHKLSVQGFKIGDPDLLIQHSTKFVLVDQIGQIRGYYEGTELDTVSILNKTIKQLLKTPPN